MDVGRPVVASELLDRESLTLPHGKTGREADLALEAELDDVGAEVVRVVVRGRERVVRIGVEVEDGVRSALGETGEHVEEAGQQLPRLVAAVGEHDERVGEAEGGFDGLAVGRRREGLEVDAVADDLAVDTAAPGNLAAVV